MARLGNVHICNVHSYLRKSENEIILRIIEKEWHLDISYSHCTNDYRNYIKCKLKVNNTMNTYFHQKFGQT